MIRVCIVCSGNRVVLVKDHFGKVWHCRDCEQEWPLSLTELWAHGQIDPPTRGLLP